MVAAAADVCRRVLFFHLFSVYCFRCCSKNYACGIIKWQLSVFCFGFEHSFQLHCIFVVSFPPPLHRQRHCMVPTSGHPFSYSHPLNDCRKCSSTHHRVNHFAGKFSFRCLLMRKIQEKNFSDSFFYFSSNKTSMK